VLDDGGQRHVEGLSQPRHRYRSLAEFLQDGAACGVTQGVKHAVDIWSFSIHESAGFSACVRLTRNFLRQFVEEFAPTILAHLGAVGALEERSLVGANEVRPGFRW
jgi:hypothetical protein